MQTSTTRIGALSVYSTPFGDGWFVIVTHDDGRQGDAVAPCWDEAFDNAVADLHPQPSESRYAD
jgi:hypothetical protein